MDRVYEHVKLDVVRSSITQARRCIVVTRSTFQADAPDHSLIRFKFKLDEPSEVLRNRFNAFRKARNTFVLSANNDAKSGIDPSKEKTHFLALAVNEALDELIDGCKLIASFANVDGAVVIDQSFRVLGFGAEIIAPEVHGVTVIDRTDILSHERRQLNVQEAGMRHRSAIRLCANTSEVIVFVISQDGGVSLCWPDGGQVCVRKDLILANSNMPGSA